MCVLVAVRSSVCRLFEYGCPSNACCLHAGLCIPGYSELPRDAGFHLVTDHQDRYRWRSHLQCSELFSGAAWLPRRVQLLMPGYGSDVPLFGRVCGARWGWQAVRETTTLFGCRSIGTSLPMCGRSRARF